MPQFAYEALDGGGKMVKGSIEAVSEDIIAEKLRDMGFYPLKIKETKGSAGDLDYLFHALLGRIVHTQVKSH